MARYVLASRRAGKFQEAEKIRSREALVHAMAGIGPGIDVVADNDPADQIARRVVVFEADAGEIEQKKEALPPDALLEPEILFRRDAVPPPDFLPMRAAPVLSMTVVTAGSSFEVAVRGDGRALAGAGVELFLRGFGGILRSLTGTCDSEGRCTLTLPPGFVPSAVAALPRAGFWPMIIRGPRSGVVVECPPLPMDGPTGWWHEVLGLGAADPALGQGIRVGVVDTGVGPHDALGHVVGAGAFVGGRHDDRPDATRDVGGHGTHVAGIIGARPAGTVGYAGIAPGCELFAARVFASAEAASNQADIANAVDTLSRGHKADLINLSLGSGQDSAILRDSILDALERGTLCVCAAGNDGGPVGHPARLPETVAVSALGLAGSAPPGSMAAARLPQASTLFGRDNLYLANFSSHGPEVTCTAPGVGIIAPASEPGGAPRGYGAMDGTSMAAPACCAVLAGLLSRDAGYQMLPRDINRALAARSVLLRAARDVGLADLHQGRGMPSL